jgi:hypothetical protein
MKHTILKKVGSVILISGLAFTLPAFAQTHAGAQEHSMADGQQMSGMMHDMSSEMMAMSSMMGKGDMKPDAMKNMSNQMMQMGNMMESMSSMMGKGSMMNADHTKQMEQMRLKMDQMSKKMPAASAN